MLDQREKRINMYMACLADYGFELEPEDAYFYATQVVDGDITWHDIWLTVKEDERDIDEEPIGFIITTETEEAYGLLSIYILPEYRRTYRAYNALMRLILSSEDKPWMFQIRTDDERVRSFLTSVMVATHFRAVPFKPNSVVELNKRFAVYKWVRRTDVRPFLVPADTVIVKSRDEAGESEPVLIEEELPFELDADMPESFSEVMPAEEEDNVTFPAEDPFNGIGADDVDYEDLRLDIDGLEEDEFVKAFLEDIRAEIETGGTGMEALPEDPEFYEEEDVETLSPEGDEEMMSAEEQAEPEDIEEEIDVADTEDEADKIRREFAPEWAAFLNSVQNTNTIRTRANP